MKIVFLDRDTIAPQITLRQPTFEHTLQVYDRTAPNEVASRIADADILIVNKVPLTADVIAAAPKLRMVAIAATGTDNVDIAACAQKGIVVSNINNYAVVTVPEHTFALIFALRRNLLAYRDAVRAGRWQQAKQFCFFDYPIRPLRGATLGVIGEGVVGRAVADIGRALGMRVLIAAHRGRSYIGPFYTPFEDVLAQADIITLHCSLTPKTRNMITAAEFALMKRKPLLINTARGELVDESAVGPALDSGQISGAGFDVVSVEPPPLDHPYMALLDRPNFLLTPHVAWASDDAMQVLANQLIDNIEAFVRGEPVNTVRPK